MQTRPTWGQSPPTQVSRGDDPQIMTFAQMNRIRVEDRRALGGRLWLIYHGGEPTITARLVSFGFRYVPDKGWWRAE